MFDNGRAYPNQFWLATQGKTAAEKLHRAAEYNDIEAANTLLAQPVKPYAKTLKYVVERRWSNWVKPLIDAGAPTSPELADIATRKQDLKTLTILLEAGVVPAKATLDYAVKEGLTKFVDALSAKIPPATKSLKPAA